MQTEWFTEHITLGSWELVWKQNRTWWLCKLLFVYILAKMLYLTFCILYGVFSTATDFISRVWRRMSQFKSIKTFIHLFIHDLWNHKHKSLVTATAAGFLNWLGCNSSIESLPFIKELVSLYFTFKCVFSIYATGNTCCIQGSVSTWWHHFWVHRLQVH